MTTGAARRRARDQAGLTLIEVLVTVAILGIAFVTVVGGMAVSIAGSDVHRKQATSQTVLRNLAEFLKAAPYVDDTCPADYRPALDQFSSEVTEPETAVYDPGLPAADGVLYTVEIAGPVKEWNGQNNPAGFADSCNSSGLQQLTLRVRSVARPDLPPEEILLVKRRT